MEFPEEIIKMYWNHLKLCDYPNITKMVENDVRKIFNKENRVNFLSWALIKIIPDYKARLDNSKYTKKIETTIADIIHSNGFCKTSEKMHFTKSLMTAEKEIPIFNRIFKSFTALYVHVDKENITSEMASLKYRMQHPSKENFDHIISYDGNIFEDTFKKLTEAQRKDKYKEMKKTIEELDVQIIGAEAEKNELLQTVENSTHSTNIIQEEIEKLLNKLQDVTYVFAKDFPEYANNFTKISEVSTNSNLGPTLKHTSENIYNILKVLKNENYMKNNKEIKTFQERNNSASEDYSEFIVDNYVISEEILDESQDDFDSDK